MSYTGCWQSLLVLCIDFYVWDAVSIFNHLARMFSSTDFTFGITDWTCCHGLHFHAILRIISRGVSGLATDSPCGVWGRGWTTCHLPVHSENFVTSGCIEGWQLQVQPVDQCYHNDDGSGNGLLPDGTKPLPEPMLTCYLLRSYEKSFCKIHPFICQLISCKSKGLNVCHSFRSQFSKHHLRLIKLILYPMILLQRYPNSVEN